MPEAQIGQRHRGHVEWVGVAPRVGIEPLPGLGHAVAPQMNSQEPHVVPRHGGRGVPVRLPQGCDIPAAGRTPVAAILVFTYGRDGNLPSAPVRGVRGQDLAHAAFAHGGLFAVGSQQGTRHRLRVTALYGAAPQGVRAAPDVRLVARSSGRMQPTFVRLRSPMKERGHQGGFDTCRLLPVLGGFGLLADRPKEFREARGGHVLQQGREEQFAAFALPVAETEVLGVFLFHVSGDTEAGLGIRRRHPVHLLAQILKRDISARNPHPRLEQLQAAGHLPVLVDGVDEVKVVVQWGIFAPRFAALFRSRVVAPRIEGRQPVEVDVVGNRPGGNQHSGTQRPVCRGDGRGD